MRRCIHEQPSSFSLQLPPFLSGKLPLHQFGYIISLCTTSMECSPQGDGSFFQSWKRAACSQVLPACKKRPQPALWKMSVPDGCHREINLISPALKVTFLGKSFLLFLFSGLATSLSFQLHTGGKGIWKLPNGAHDVSPERTTQSEGSGWKLSALRTNWRVTGSGRGTTNERTSVFPWNAFFVKLK